MPIVICFALPIPQCAAGLPLGEVLAPDLPDTQCRDDFAYGTYITSQSVGKNKTERIRQYTNPDETKASSPPDAAV